MRMKVEMYSVAAVAGARTHIRTMLNNVACNSTRAVVVLAHSRCGLE